MAVTVHQRPLSGPRLNLSLNGNQAAQDADCYGFCPASGAKLGQNGADVELHGVFRTLSCAATCLFPFPRATRRKTSTSLAVRCCAGDSCAGLLGSGRIP
jgi:hypothetical protein